MESLGKPIFLKEDSTLKNSLENGNLELSDKDIRKIKSGIYGEDQVAYQLKSSNMPMYVLRDIHLSIDGINSQIDFVVITPHHCYFLESKNYNAKRIVVDDKGNFKFNTTWKREYQGIQSPVSQAKRQLALFKRIYTEENKIVNEKNFDNYFKYLVVFANNDVILDTSKANTTIKYNVRKLDDFLEQIEFDGNHNDELLNESQMENLANYFLYKNVDVNFEELDIDDIIEEPLLEEPLTNDVPVQKKKKAKKSNFFGYSFTAKELIVLLVLIIVCIGILFITFFYLLPNAIQSM